jgi:hypothetical protein
MNQFGNDFFAGATGPLDEDWNIGRGNHSQVTLDLLHGF